MVSFNKEEHIIVEDFSLNQMLKHQFPNTYAAYLIYFPSKLFISICL